MACSAVEAEPRSFVAVSGTIDGVTPPLSHAVFARYPRQEAFGTVMVFSVARPCERWTDLLERHAAAEDLPSDAREAARSDAFLELFGGELVWVLQIDVPSHELGLREAPTSGPPLDDTLSGSLSATKDFAELTHRSDVIAGDLTVHEADGEVLDASLSVRLAPEDEPRDVQTLDLELLALRCDSILE